MDGLALRTGSRLFTYAAHFAAATDNKQRQYEIFKRILRGYQGLDILIITDYDNFELGRTELSIPVGSTSQFNKWFDDNYIMEILELGESGDYIMDPLNNYDKEPENQAKFRVFNIVGASPIAINQAYLDSGGISHCVLDPMIEWASELLEKNDGTNKKYKYKSVLDLCAKYKIEYSDGIPEDKLTEVCRATGFDINIYVPSIFEEHTRQINIKGGKGKINFTKTFNFINGRINHLDFLLNTNKVTELSREEFDIKEKEYIENDVFYSYNKTKTTI